MSAKRTHDKPAEVYLPITPFLDLAFQLLFFFIVIFKPPSSHQLKTEGELALSRPEKKNTTAASDPAKVDLKRDAHKEAVDLKADFTVRVIGYKNVPRYKGLVLEVLIEDANGILGRNDKPGVAPHQCRYKVAADGGWKKQFKDDLESFKPKGEKDAVPVLTMRVESDTQWDQIVMVMDLCYKAGFQVSFAQPKDDNVGS